MASVLIVDDESAFTSGIAEFLRLKDHKAVTANTVAGGRDALADGIPDVLLLDLMLPDGSGLELLDTFEDRKPGKIIIITGHTGVKSLIGGMAGDGVEYMKKPIEPKDLLGIINAMPIDDDAADSAELHFNLLIGESESMQAMYQSIRQVAPTDSTVLVQGESGTGKELVAEALHRMSHASGPFVPVNCGGLSQELVSSQLFGHEKGSFTGANKRHAGFFERARNGTLFLDEITEMPIDMQTHLLRVLETGKVLPVGAEQEVDVNARLVAATNRDPAKAVRENELREDLYFRLRVFPITLPPLRERHGDVPLLAEYFLQDLNRRNGTNKAFAGSALEELQKHSWPGNVRELKHTVHRSYIMAGDAVVEAPTHFDDDVSGKVEGLRVGRSIADVEKDLILATMEQFKGDKKAAASSLGVSLKTLYNRLKEYEGEPAADA